MTSPATTSLATSLADDAARRTALTVHDRTFLVEAGAGSGKTAILAGRIALMLAAGIPARQIAAVTFTELAASELVARVRHFVEALAAGAVPAELAIALPHGIDAAQAGNLARAADDVDDIACTTIHGFCQRLVRPYPVEAGIDPGATVIDPDEADLRFTEIVDDWLRSALDEGADGLLVELTLHDETQTLTLVRELAAHGRSRELTARPLPDLDPPLTVLRRAVGVYADFVASTGIDPCELTEVADAFRAAAHALPDPADPSPAGLVALLAARLDPCLSGRIGGRAYQNKGRWGTAAAAAGLSRADGTRFFETAVELHGRCHAAWGELKEAVAARVLAELVPVVAPVAARYRAWKRAAALLDFDDLIGTARTLLATEPAVRDALGRRYAHLLVDEFQDTDPVQTEVFWRLAGDAVDEDWRHNAIRPGALFLVGDPKQAIYRFRGADVAAYVSAREAIRAADPGSLLSISTNFRSLAPILLYVNERFAPVLSAVGQPGFIPLDAYHPHEGDAPTVAALDVAVGDAEGAGAQNRKRDAEAETVADACARMIGTLDVLDRDAAGGVRPCRAGDIALLAPTGTELWRYEEALEKRGLAVTTQAGKGFFHRQEVKDLIAITRVLADSRDRLALGALLRGPVVGLTDEDLLDIVAALPRDPARPDALPRLSLHVDPAAVAHPHARDILEKLQALWRRKNATTPHRLLAEAVDVLRLRPVLLARHGGRAERPLANVDLFLSMAQAYDVRGLVAFARAVTAHWAEGSRVQEGRPDAGEGAVTIYTMHAAKGLEWPVVIPINAMGGVRDEDGLLVDRETGTISRRVFGLAPRGHGVLHEAEREERRRERQRLWYVAATRARQLLVLPRLDAPAGDKAWCSLVDLALDELEPLPLPGAAAATRPPPAAAATQTQTQAAFRAEAAAIVAARRQLVWHVPSRHEGTVPPPEGDDIGVDLSALAGEGEGEGPAVRGGRIRGLVLHKLLEEVLTGEVDDDAAALEERGAALLASLGSTETHDPGELAACVVRTLALPEVAAHRPRLVPELPVYAFADDGGAMTATAGVADAVALGEDGAPALVIDWKSDVAPAAVVVAQYREQIRAYLAASGIGRGLLVFMTSGRCVAVER